MPAPLKSFATLQASGSVKTHPGRYAERGDEMEPSGELRECPDFLNELQKQCWNEIVAYMPPGVLKNADNFAVENLARLQALIRSGEAGPTIYAQAIQHLDRFGMNPKARPNVQVPVKKKESSFSDV